MARKKEKQSTTIHFAVYGQNVDLYSKRPRRLNQTTHFIYSLCRRQLSKLFPGLKFQTGDRGKVKITIEIVERE